MGSPTNGVSPVVGAMTRVNFSGSGDPLFTAGMVAAEETVANAKRAAETVNFILDSSSWLSEDRVVGDGWNWMIEIERTGPAIYTIRKVRD